MGADAQANQSSRRACRLRGGTHGFGLAESELSLVARHAGLSFPPWVLSECLKQLCNDIKSSILCKMRMLHGKPASGVAGVLLGATTSVTAASLRRPRQRRPTCDFGGSGAAPAGGSDTAPCFMACAGGMMGRAARPSRRLPRQISPGELRSTSLRLAGLAPAQRVPVELPWKIGNGRVGRRPRNPA